VTKKALTTKARNLRRQMTDAERLPWSHLRSRQIGAKFVRQFPIGPFIADFASRSLRIIIEINGGQHAIHTERDEAQTKVIEAYGYRVIRFWNNDIIDNIESAPAAILDEIEIARGH
jgi:BirA family biotin operon repressor/biotin-[acetyl-CoA-carboxylase] ligase